MNINKLNNLCSTFGFPATIILFGLILLISPDSATALVFQLIGWILVIAGAGKAIFMAKKSAISNAGGWIAAAVCVAAGIFLLKKPLVLSNLLGRFLGILLLVEGAQDLRRHGENRLMAIITAGAGIVLFLLPRTLANVLLTLCGAVLIIVGVLNLLGRLRNYRQLAEPSDPNIIDADA